MISNEFASNAAHPNDPVPLLFSNVAAIIACPTKKEFAKAFHVSPSAACKWEETQRMPLRHLAPILSVVSWDLLSGPDLKDSIHVGRGYTRDEAIACRDGSGTGPILLQFRNEIDEVMDRIKLIVGSTEYKKIGERINTNSNQVATWVKRRKIPDPIYHRFANNCRVNLTWLLTGSGERQAQIVVPSIAETDRLSA